MLNQIFWHKYKQPKSHMLMRDTVTDVVIVGGGLAGLMCAEGLNRQGAQVVVLEKETCGSGSSGSGFGGVGPSFGISPDFLVKKFDIESARGLWGFALSGSELIYNLAQDYGNVCDCQAQNIFAVTSSQKGFKKVASHHKARIELGLDSVLYDKYGVREVLGSKEYFGGMSSETVCAINGYALCQELKEQLQERGVKVFEYTPVNGIDFKSNIIHANGFQVRSSKVVLCSDNDAAQSGFLKKHLYPIQTWVAVSRPLKDFQLEQLFHGARLLVQDLDLMYHYYRVTGDNRLVVSTSNNFFAYTKASHSKTDSIGQNISRYFKEKYPRLAVEFEYVWPTFTAMTRDSFPIAGRNVNYPDTYFMGGVGGLSWAVALGGYLSEKIVRGRSELDHYFSPNREMPLNSALIKILGKPLGFAISHKITKIK